ncbi:MAG: 3-phosphoshikimate 1-carboxyvinyltransferase [Bacteroidales bacterium]|nr:3-phosphoshikimate 1-carboxyvinyltransferase [Bacteroidales bacterium]
MNKLLKPSAFNAELTIPSSKSYMQRAVALSILADGQSTLVNPDFSNDSRAGLGIAKTLGCDVQELEGRISVTGIRDIRNTTVSVGEAGLGLRLFTPVCALFGREMTIEGHGTLLTRPMNMLEQPMKELGADISLTNGSYAPIHIHSGIRGGNVEIDGSESSQFLTGLLVALPLAENDSVLTVKNLKSLPYVQMTIDIIKKFGGEIINEDFKVFRIKGRQKYTATEYIVEGDWSSAAAHLVAGATSGKAVVRGLNPDSLQADKAVLEVLRSCGADVRVSDNEITIEKKELKAFDFDATNCPDLFPVLASLAASCEGDSHIKGVTRLAHKESDRANAIKDEFQKIGIKVLLDGDIMTITGGKIHGAKVSSHKDHRMAMSMAVCALNADGIIEVDNAECVGKSYPRFWDDYENSVVSR